LPAHGAIEVLLGMAMLLAPAVLGFHVAGLVLSVALGAIQIGFGLTFTAPGRYATAWRAHLDSLLSVATAVGALGMAAAGQAPAAIFLAAMVAFQVSLNLGTRYVQA
jgi:divalent metal cation (Fe/Co/Zn/Cd) transporter